MSIASILSEAPPLPKAQELQKSPGRVGSISLNFVWFVWPRATDARSSTNSQRQKFSLLRLSIKWKRSESSGYPNLNNNCICDSLSIDLEQNSSSSVKTPIISIFTFAVELLTSCSDSSKKTPLSCQGVRRATSSIFWPTFLTSWPIVKRSCTTVL